MRASDLRCWASGQLRAIGVHAAGVGGGGFLSDIMPSNEEISGR
jgi:hypothetical protein